ncbi:mCG1048791, partial [Mus musculus]
TPCINAVSRKVPSSPIVSGAEIQAFNMSLWKKSTIIIVTNSDVIAWPRETRNA